jgi:HK97 family phage major capsid protein
MKTELKELREAQDAKRDELKGIFDEAGPDRDMSKVKSIEGDTAAKVEHIRKINDELDELAKKAAPLEEEMAVLSRADRELKAREAALDRNPSVTAPRKGDERKPVKSIGDLLIDSKALHELKGREVEIEGVSLKTLFQTSAGWSVEDVRTGRLVDAATRPVQVTDLIPSGTTSGSAVVYMEETTFTNAAAETAEGSPKPEAALALTERTEPVRKIAVWLPVTDEQLEDVPGVRNYLNNRLPFMVRQRLDGQIIVGDGTSPNLRGFLNRAGIQTQAKGADPVPDAIYKAMTKVRVTGRALPTGVVLHPNDWQDIRLLRTADGLYIWGNPSEAGPERIWGLQVVQSDAITENTGLVGDFANFSELAIRSGISVEVSNSHGTYFVENKQAVRAEMRAALCVFRHAAFCQITGI